MEILKGFHEGGRFYLLQLDRSDYWSGIPLMESAIFLDHVHMFCYSISAYCDEIGKSGGASFYSMNLEAILTTGLVASSILAVLGLLIIATASSQKRHTKGHQIHH